MRRRDFIRTTLLAGSCFAVGFPRDIFSEPFACSTLGQPGRLNHQFAFPHGGCTDAGIVFFENGPSGNDPFHIYD